MSHPMGLRGRRAAGSVPTAVAGTTATVATSASTTGPPVPAWWVRLSSGTVDMSTPSVRRPSATAATGAARSRRKDATLSPQPPGPDGANSRGVALRKRYGDRL